MGIKPTDFRLQNGGALALSYIRIWYEWAVSNYRPPVIPGALSLSYTRMVPRVGFEPTPYP